MPGESVEHFLELLKGSPPGAVFNPWWQVDKETTLARVHRGFAGNSYATISPGG